MAAKEGNTLCSHPTFYATASKGLCQIDQIYGDHIFGHVSRIYVSIIGKKIAKLTEVITNSVWAVMPD